MARKGVKQTTSRRKTDQRKSKTPALGSKDSPGSRIFFWTGISLAVFAFLLYINTLGHQYTLDDPLAIAQNEYVTKGLGGIPDLLINHYRAGTVGAQSSALLYRPLSLITFAIEWSLAPNSPFIGHLMNVLWYAMTVALMFAVLRRMFKGFHWLWAAGAALLFAVHPLHSEVVANIKSRDEILSVFFCLASLYTWTRWLEQPHRRWLWMGLGSYLLALLSKESAVTMFPVFPLVSWVFFRKNAQTTAGHALLFAIPVALFLIVRGMVLSQTADQFAIHLIDNPIVEANGFGERSATGFMVLWKYLQILVFPYPLLSDYSFKHLSVVNWGNWQAIAGLLAYVGLGVFAVWGTLKRRPLAFFSFAFLCGVVLYSQLLLVIGTLFGERLMYLPSIWFCSAAGLLLWRLTGFDPKNTQESTGLPPIQQIWRGVALFTVVVAFFGIKTVGRNLDWKDNFTLLTSDCAKAPNSVRLQNGVANASFLKYQNENSLSAPEKEELLNKVEQHANTALSLLVNPNSYLHLGNAAQARGQYAEAIRQYEASLKQDPAYPLARINIGRTYRAWGNEEIQVNKNLPQAAKCYEKALEYGENDAGIYMNLGASYGMMGDHEKAIRFFEQAAAIDPNNQTIWKNLGKSYRAIGNLPKAEECERRAGG